MPTTLTLKNIPNEVYDRLKASAEANRRSMNSEAIVRLESALMPGKLAPIELLAQIRAVRETLPKANFNSRDIDTFKKKGRT